LSRNNSMQAKIGLGQQFYVLYSVGSIDNTIYIIQLHTVLCNTVQCSQTPVNTKERGMQPSPRLAVECWPVLTRHALMVGLEYGLGSSVGVRRLSRRTNPQAGACQSGP
jgi:hypothetical protein